MKILSIQPFLGGYLLSPAAGGKNKAALRLNQALTRRGDQVYVMPWFEDHVASAPVSFGEEGLHGWLVPTIAWPGRADFATPLRALLYAAAMLRAKGRQAMQPFHRAIALRRAMDRIEPDIVHVNHTTSTFPALYRRQGHRAPLLLTHTHGLGQDLDCFDHVAFFSGFSRDGVVAASGYAAAATSVVHAGVDGDYLDAAPAEADGRIVFQGALKDERKGLDLLLDAYRADDALRRHPLHVVGEGPLRRRYERRAEGLDATFHGRLSNADAAGILARASVFVLPSREESFGIAYVEALALGVPVVGFGPAVREFEQVLGVAVGEPFDAGSQSPADLAAIVRRVIADDRQGDPATRRTRRARIAETFTWPRFGERYAALYECLVKSRKEKDR